MATYQPPSIPPAKNRKTWLWIGAASAGIFFLLSCCCIGILLSSNKGGGGSVTSSGEEVTVPQITKNATKAPFLLQEQKMDYEEVTGEELKHFGAEMGAVENSIDPLVAWASDEGYFSSQNADEIQAVRVNLPGGEEIRAFYIGEQANPDNGLVFLQAASVRKNGKLGGRSLAARMEGSETNPFLVLFDQDRQVKISAEKFDFSSVTSQLETVQMTGFSTQNLNPPSNYASGCTTTAWDEYEACFISSNNNSILSYGVSCPVALATAYVVWTGTSADTSGNLSRILKVSAIISAVNACGTAALTCLDDSMDDSPTYRIVSELKPVDTVWKSCNQDQSGIFIQNRFQTTLEWSDDRLPFLENNIRVYEFPPNLKEIVQVKDCGGNFTGYQVKTGSAVFVDSSPCGPTNICREDGQGNASCEPSSGNPLPPPAQPGQTISSRGVFKFKDGTPVYAMEKNYLDMRFNSSGGPATGSGVILMSVDASMGMCKRETGTFSFNFDGSYNAENGTLSGYWTAVGDFQSYAAGSCAPDTQHQTYSGTFEAEQGTSAFYFVGSLYQSAGPGYLGEMLQGFVINTE